ncbi:MAG: hypothetical protein FJ104_11750, partial [Deltaproteobacteria bacterium]|nr:hypothetical protein [Deltaproteobacteria bacterium]
APDGGGSGGGTGTGGGGTGTGGGTSGPKCDKTPCDDQLAALLSQLSGGADAGSSAVIKTCCQNDTACGVDVSLLSGLVQGLPQGCVDPSAFTDGGLFGGGPGVFDGGIIPSTDGGPPVQLDSTCAGIALENPILPLKLPGCCQPTGVCGGATHLLPDLVNAPVTCASHAYVETFVEGLGFGETIKTPPDPNKACTYPAALLPDAGGGSDASTGADGGGGASTGDASTGDAG